jgi:hypothetical protein
VANSRRRRLRRGALVAVPLVAAAVGAGVLLWPSERAPEPESVPLNPAPPPAPVKAAAPKRREPRPSPRPRKRRLRVHIDRAAARPVSVAIESAGISAPVIPLGLRRDGSLEVPRNFSEAGWRVGGPEPGERGAALIAGHVDSKAGPAAFYRLRDVRRGQEVEVRRADGSTVTFVVRRMEQVAKRSFPTRRVYGKTRLPTLRLVTCGGSFDRASGHYRDNVIAYATRKPS